MLEFEEKTLPSWNHEMSALLEEGDPRAEGGRRWLMPDLRMRHSIFPANAYDLGTSDASLLREIVRFRRITSTLNTEILLLSGELIRYASRPEKKSAIDDHDQTRALWRSTAVTLLGQLKQFSCD